METPATVDAPVTLPAELASALRISVARLARRLRAEQTGDALSATQAAALSSLARHGPLTPSALAEHEKVQPPSMTRVIGILEDKGLATRSPHPTDARQV
ncbi:MAG: MarR family winged helix-turn-helix transcriptional regulator, partial [Candidatus Dormibacteraceae bacterium]